jgi:hypothetical protein
MVRQDPDRADWFPTGIVLLPGPAAVVVPEPRRPAQQQDVPVLSGARTGWTIVDAHGVQLAGWPTHRLAMGDLGCHALRGATMPLRVHGPDGRPTGDRLG